MTPILIRQLRKTFGQTVAVDGIDLDIGAGELFFLLGPSGCGKTTLLRMIAGFTDPTSGEIKFGDHNVTHLPPNKRNTGMVFQGYALWPHMTVRQNVAFGLEVRKVSKKETDQRVDEALASVQLSAQAERKINQLSGGQQQRVALARALVIKPTVLLLDEPLSNLDAKLRLEMRQSIRDICKASGITGVYVTHDQKEALSMADGVAVLNAGQVMQVGPPRKLYERPANRFVADFLGETNFITAEVKGREPTPPGISPGTSTPSPGGASGGSSGGELVVLDTPMGPLRSSVYPDELPTGGNVTVSIRPETITLSPQAPPEPTNASFGGTNHFAATPAGSVYLGEMAQYRLAINGETTLKAFELNPRFVEAVGPIQSATVAPEDVVILKD